MASLNPNYMLAPSLQQLFRDKDTGLPLSNGKVFFYRDISRAELKPVYQLSGVPGNYTYTALPNPVILDAVGAFPSAIYYFPFDESEQPPTTVDLYYIEVYDENDVLQFTREGYPDFAEDDTSGDVDVNFIPNGQFTLHTDLQNDGEIAAESTDIAPGNWKFIRSAGSTATDILLFNRVGSYTATPEGNPRYYVNPKNTAPGAGGDAVKDLRVVFRNVNRFASATQQYTFRFWGQNLLGGTVDVQLLLIKNYGTGGSAQDEVQLGPTLSVGTALAPYSVVFTFGENDTKTIGTGDDDTVSLALRFPGNQQYDAQFTDFSLLQGAKTGANFPTQTTQQDLYRAVMGSLPVPAYDGSDNYLGVVNVENGFIFDHSVVGTIVATIEDEADIGAPHHFCGGKMLKTSDRTNGVPNSRLEEKMYIPSLGVHKWGNGLDFCEITYSTSPPAGSLMLANNRAGVVAPVAIGAGLASFQLRTIHSGPDYHVLSSILGADLIQYETKFIGTNNGIGFGTAPFVFLNQYQDTSGVAGPSEDAVPLTYEITVTANAANALRDRYFEFSARDTDFGAVNDYYLWYASDGIGTDPSIGGRTGVRCDLENNDSTYSVAVKTIAALRGYHATNIICSDATSIAGGDYFTFQTKTASGTQDYYVYYTKDGAGADPAPGGIGIAVAVLTGDSAATVGSRTYAAINRAYFAVPDLRGRFLRGLQNSLDPDALIMDRGNRFSYYHPYLAGFTIGSEELSFNMDHGHAYDKFTSFANRESGPENNNITTTTSEILSTTNAGINESRPRNTAVNFKIHY